MLIGSPASIALFGLAATVFSLMAVVVMPHKAMAQKSPADARAAVTMVRTFTPAIPHGKASKGSCWTTSIAADRPGAWRCMIGNAIHDPCFSVPSLSHAVVCDANPVLDKMGFVLKLTKPLPANDSSANERDSPWIMQLADGSVCEPYTGTMPMVNGETAPWFCINPGEKPRPNSGWLVTTIHHGKVWTVERYPESAASYGDSTGAPGHLKAEFVPVIQVWK